MKRLAGLLPIFCCLAVLCAGCQQSSLLSYDEFWVYTTRGGIYTGVDALTATEGAEDIYSFSGNLAQRYLEDSGRLATKRGIGPGSSLEDFERMYGEVPFRLFSSSQPPQPLSSLLSGINPYGAITLQASGTYECRAGQFLPFPEEQWAAKAAEGKELVMVRMLFLFQSGNLQDIQLFTKTSAQEG